MATSLNRIAEQVNAEIQIRTDRESSMLKGEERAAANSAVKRIIERYQGTLRERGGPENVLKEMAAYLASKTGDALSTTDPTHRQGLDPYRTALRAILDPEEKGKPGVKKAGFENLLHPEARLYEIEYAQGKPGIPLRELLAYYWLAASDPDMPLSEEQLATVPGDGSDQEKRSVLIEGEKENLIVKLAEIRRAHNGDTGHHSENSVIDEPSCGAGTFGRIVSSPLYNPIGKLQVNPVAGFPWNIEAFIFKKFQATGKEVASGYQFHVDKYLTYLEPEETPESIESAEKYQEFLRGVKQSKSEFLSELEKEYGNALTPERRKYAEKLYEEISDNLDLSKAGIRPRQTLINRMNESVVQSKKKEILKEISEQMKSQYVEHYSKVSDEFAALTQQLASYDFERASNAELTQNKLSLVEKHNGLIKQKESGDLEIWRY